MGRTTFPPKKAAASHMLAGSVGADGATGNAGWTGRLCGCSALVVVAETLVAVDRFWPDIMDWKGIDDGFGRWL